MGVNDIKISLTMKNKGKNEPHQQIKSYWRFLEISVPGKYKNIVFIKCAKISAFKRI